MSSTISIVLLVPLLDGTNYHQWAIAMKTYLQVQELWSIIGGNKTAPKRPAALDNAAKDEQKAIYNVDMAEYKAKHETWTLKNEKAYGTILLHLSATIQATQKAITARNLWSELDEEFNQPHNMTIFSDFKYCLDYHLLGHSDPMPDILKIEDCFNCLANQQCSIPELIKGMILLNALPPKWHSIAEIYLQGNNEVNDIRFSTVKYAIRFSTIKYAIRFSTIKYAITN